MGSGDSGPALQQASFDPNRTLMRGALLALWSLGHDYSMPWGWTGCEMSEESDAATRYLQRAEELRIIARSKQTKENRQTLLSIAADYEIMAVHARPSTPPIRNFENSKIQTETVPVNDSSSYCC